MPGILTITPFSTKEVLIRLGIAVVIGCVVGIEREYKNRPAGLRTHVLV
jgi:putative Mg2+ transporter-C (MgtC) family protein